MATKKWEEMARLGAPAVVPLIQALQDEGDEVRELAAWALGEIGDVRAVIEKINSFSRHQPQGRRKKAKTTPKGELRAEQGEHAMTEAHAFSSPSSRQSQRSEPGGP